MSNTNKQKSISEALKFHILEYNDISYYQTMIVNKELNTARKKIIMKINETRSKKNSFEHLINYINGVLK